MESHLFAVIARGMVNAIVPLVIACELRRRSERLIPLAHWLKSPEPGWVFDGQVFVSPDGHPLFSTKDLSMVKKVLRNRVNKFAVMARILSGPRIEGHAVMLFMMDLELRTVLETQARGGLISPASFPLLQGRASSRGETFEEMLRETGPQLADFREVVARIEKVRRLTLRAVDNAPTADAAFAAAEVLWN